jgi:hypothetical protein
MRCVAVGSNREIGMPVAVERFVMSYLLYYLFESSVLLGAKYESNI